MGRAIGACGWMGALLVLGGGCGSVGREPVVEAADQPEGAAVAAAGRRIAVRAEGLRFRPSELRVKRGETLQVEVANEGTLEHNLEVALPGGAVEFRENLKPGETRVLQFTAPTRPGSYGLTCPVDDHAARGMTGTLVVEP